MYNFLFWSSVDTHWLNAQMKKRLDLIVDLSFTTINFWRKYLYVYLMLNCYQYSIRSFLFIIALIILFFIPSWYFLHIWHCSSFYIWPYRHLTVKISGYFGTNERIWLNNNCILVLILCILHPANITHCSLIRLMYEVTLN